MQATLRCKESGRQNISPSELIIINNYQHTPSLVSGSNSTVGLGGNLSLFTSEDVNFPRLQLLCFTAKMAPEGLETDAARRQEGVHEQGPDTVLEARQTQTQRLCSEGTTRGMPFRRPCWPSSCASRSRTVFILKSTFAKERNHPPGP